MKIRDCPFCKNKKVIQTEDLTDGLYWCYCMKCKCCGPVADSETDAIKIWNKRERKEATMSSLAKKACQLAQLLSKLSGTDDNGYGMCWYTGKILSWKELNGCHWLPKGRTYRAACIDPRNIHPGGSMENNLNDNYKYTIRMQTAFGKDILDELERLNHTELSREQLTEYIKDCREVCREYAKNKSFPVNIP